MNKDLLRAFGKASAMNAFPSSQKIDIPVVAEQWWNEYVAPADGFVFVSGETHAGEAGGGCGRGVVYDWLYFGSLIRHSKSDGPRKKRRNRTNSGEG